MQIIQEFKVTKKYLDDRPNSIFIYGENILKKGCGGAARLRYHTQSYGFITKKYPNHNMAEAYYMPSNYRVVFEKEVSALINMIKKNPDKEFLISKLGAGLANAYKIFEHIIEPDLPIKLKEFSNVKFLWG